jgi:hypothetical protein
MKKRGHARDFEARYGIPQLHICVPISEGMLYRFGQVEVLDGQIDRETLFQIVIRRTTFRPGRSFSEF